MTSNDLLICLISGGASALLPAPIEPITLQDKRRLTEQLIRTRATIHEINTVRRHISALKGGRLVEKCVASSIISFIISDVAGNTLHDIASGLTAPDPTTYGDAVQVLRKYDIWGKIPRTVRQHLERGLAGKICDTPKPASPIFDRVHNFIIADNRYACVAAKTALQVRRIPTKVLTSQADMEAKSLGKLLASIGISSKTFREPIRNAGAIIVGGETTVNVTGNGKGGRNQHTALCALQDLAGQDGLAIAAFGTDGIDGNSTAAGAIVDGNSSRRAKRIGIDPQEFLARSDSFHFFRRLNDNIITGRTGTNVGDIYITVKVGK
jgi:glycerate-2-kinase